MQAMTIGIDLAKHVFQLHGMDQHNKTALTRKLKRDQRMTFKSHAHGRAQVQVNQTRPA